ncbi:MAG TPA: hypothetical protein VH247_15285 [Thermoleophilaceae bacterium]|jgi:hypothetical protein|nr:hypothetical protein [Thermoleophilaceae bacterium]
MREVSEKSAPYSITFESFGLQLQARAPSEEMLARIEDCIPPMARRIEPGGDTKRFAIVEEGDGFHSVWNPNNMVCTHAGTEYALLTLEGQLRSWVAVNAPDAIFIHAGAVGHDGSAVIVPGDSFSGKTTLVTELIRRGAEYFSDEFAVIDREGLIHPYPKPLSIRSRANGELRETDTPVEDLGGTAADRPLPLSVAAVTYFVPGAEWRPRRLSRGEGVLSLLSRCVPARNRPEEALRFITAAAENAVVLEGERGEAAEFAEMVLSGALV